MTMFSRPHNLPWFPSVIVLVFEGELEKMRGDDDFLNREIAEVAKFCRNFAMHPHVAADLYAACYHLDEFLKTCMKESLNDYQAQNPRG